MKWCPSCRQEKDSTAFNKNAAQKDGLSCQCLDCIKAYRQTDSYKKGNRRRSRDWQLKNPAERYAKNKKWLESRPGLRAEYQQKRREMVKRSTVGRVDRNAILAQYGRKCHICGGDISEHLEFDHVIPLSAGGEHSNDNIRPAHRSCNRRKHANQGYEVKV